MLLRYRILLENGLCIAALAVAAVAACYPAVLRNQLPVAAKGLWFETPWSEARPPGTPAAAAQEHGLDTVRYYPWYVFLADAAKYRDSVRWTPYEGFGMPFLALWRTRCLSPFSLPFYVLGEPQRALVLSVLMKLFAAGLCGFYAARRFGAPPALAMVAALSLEFSGGVYLRMVWPMSDVLPWLPLLIVYAERLVLGQARYWPFGAVVIALMTLGGSPETLAAALLFFLLFVAVRFLFERERPEVHAAPLAALAASLVLGLALAAAQLIPFIEFLRHAANPGRTPVTAVFRLADAVLAFLPQFYGQGPGAVAHFGGAEPVNVLKLAYAGLPHVLLLPLWFALRPYAPGIQRRRIEALLAVDLALLVLALVLGPRAVQLPPLWRIAPEYFLAGHALAFAFLAAATLQEWLELDAEQCSKTLARLLIFAPLFALLAGAALWFAWAGRPNEAPSIWLQGFFAAALTLAVLVLLTASLFRPSIRFTGYAFSALAATALLAAFLPSLPRTPAPLVFPETSLIETLDQHRGRVAGYDDVARWPLAGNLIPQVFCPSGVRLKRHAAFIHAFRGDAALLDRMGTDLFLWTGDDAQGPMAALRPAMAVAEVFPAGAALMHYQQAAAPAQIVYRVRPAETYEGAAIASHLPPLYEGAHLPKPAPALSDEVSLAPAERYDEVRLRVQLDAPGILVLREAWHPGWKAEVDGQPVAVEPVDALFRGAALEPGEHTVRFYYAPLSHKLGLLITLLTAIGVLAGMGSAMYLRLRSARTHR